MYWRGLWGFTVIGVFMLSCYAYQPLALAKEGVKVILHRHGLVQPDSSLSR